MRVSVLQTAALFLAAALASSSANAQSSCVAPQGQCGSNAGFQCCTSGNYCQPWNDNFYQCVAVPSGCNTLETDTDYDGQDVKAFFGVTLPADCCKLCNDEPQCEFFTFVNSWGPACYLKKGMGTKRVFKGSVVGRKTVAATTTPSTCGTVENGVDYYGNDLRSVENVDQAGCCSACNNDANCKVYTYVPSTRGCYLKTSAAGRKTASGVISGAKLSTTPIVTPSTRASGLESEIDYNGNDLRTVNNVDLAGCCSACNNDANCKVFTHVAASLSCYLKTSDAGRKYGAGAVSGKKLVTTPPPTTPAPTTPAPTTPAPTQAPSTCSGLESDIDYYGNDLRAVNNVDLAGCCSACNGDANCKVFTYVPATSSCYLKTSAAGRKAGSGVVSGKKAVSVPSTCGSSVDTDVDYYGNDIRQVNGVDLGGCCSACNNDANCGAYTYWASSQTCYLKTKNGGSVAAPGAVSGKKVAAVVPATCGASVDKDVDYYGNDIRQVNGVDLGGCCSACNNDAGCGAYTYWASSQTCYLKSKNGGSSVAVGAVSGKKVATTPATCAAGLETDVDYYGNDLRTVNGVDLGGCCSACNSDPSCNVYTYVASGQACYLKTKNTGRVASVGAVSGVKRASSTGDWDTTRCGSKKLSIYFHGNDIADSEKAFDTVEECCDYCRSNAKCKLFTYFRRGSQKRCLLKTGTQSAEKTRYDDRDGLYVASGSFA